MFNKVASKEDGEGLVISNPDSIYDQSGKRSNQRVKLKVRMDDEAIVRGYELGHKKLGPKALKSITVGKIPTGSTKLTGTYSGPDFQIGVGFNEDDRLNYRKFVPIGSIITFSYRGIGSGGKPKEAKYVGVRDEATF